MLKKIITFPLLVVVSLYIFVVEEFIWNPAVSLLKWIRKSPTILAVENWIARRKGGWAVAALVIIPGLSVWPVKLFALYLLGHGHPFIGVFTFLLVKVVATALFAQVYSLVGEECEKVSLFRSCSSKVRWVRDWVQSQSAYQQAQATLSLWKTTMKHRKNIFKQRFLAILRRTRARQHKVDH
jgi:hypothetical protein